MCETKVVQCDRCHSIDSRWLVMCEARLAGVPCFVFDMELASPEDFDQACEHCPDITPDMGQAVE